MEAVANARVFSEVNSLLYELGEEYIRRIPEKLMELIDENKDDEYNPKYNIDENLMQQGMAKESLSLFALIDVNYWCTNEEKEDIAKQLNNNLKRIQEEEKKKYSIDKMFNQNRMSKNEEIKEDAIRDTENALMIIKEQKWYQRMFDKIKMFFGFKCNY